MNTAKPQFDYLNFDLLIERAGNAYVARVTNSPAGEAASQFSVPFAPFELENFLLKIGRPRRGVRRLNSPEMEAAKNFGKRLFDSVFGSEVFGCLRSSLDQAEAKGSAGLRLRLRLNAPELADLPWEYLYNSALNRFLVLAVETPLVRYIELPERIRPLAVQPPLKILAMLSAPTDYAPLDVEEEWQKLQNALGDLQKRKIVTLERLDEATLPALQRRLRQSSYHIFHFIGHGGYDESAHDGILLLEDETRHSRKVSGQFLGTILHNHRALRLAVLNACEGARASRTDPFTGAAQSLVQQGLPAVIAMQFEITDAAAITFSHEFYSALADGYPVDAALVEARTAIFASGNDVEWGTPVLYMRAPDGKIFDLASSAAPQSRMEKTSPPDAAPFVQPQFDEVLALSQEAQRAYSAEDWPTAIAKCQAILRLRPDNAEAKTGLARAEEEARLARLYAEGRGHKEAKRWSQALETLRQVQKIRPQYKQVNELVTAIERSLAEQNRSAQVAALLQEAEAAAAREDWQTAIARLQKILELDPTHAEAKSILRSARQELELAKLYDEGQAHLTAKRWQQAIQSFRRVQELRGHYEDVDALLATAEREWRKEQEAQKPQTPPQPPPKAPRRSRSVWFLSGFAVLIIVLSWQIYKTIYTETPTLLSITTMPTNALVLLKDNVIGNSPITGYRGTAGKFTLQIQKPNYFSLDTTVILVKGRETQLSFALKPALARVTIQVQPVDAEVILDSKSLSPTERQKLPLSLGVHSLNLSRAGYKPRPLQFRVATPRDTTLSFTLDPEVVAESGTIRVQAFLDGRVYIDDTLRGNIAGGETREYDQPVGSYRVEVRGADETVSQIATVAKGKTTTVTLRPKPVTPLETKLTPKYALRSVGKNNLSAAAVKNMLKEQDLFCAAGYDWSNPQGRGLANDFVLQSGGKVVFDRATGLIWQQAGSPEYMTYEKALANVVQLNSGNFAGYADWRLPTLEEAMSLMEPSKLNGDLYIDPKFDKKQRWIWTADKESAGWAWVAGFSIGDSFPYYGLALVRAVRAGQ